MAEINITDLYGNSTGLSSQVTALNTISGGLFVDFLLISIFLVIIFLLRNNQFKDAFISGSLVTLLFAVLLWAGDYTSFNRVTVSFSVFILAIALSWVDQ